MKYLALLLLFTSSAFCQGSLPIISIETNGNTIVDEPKVLASMIILNEDSTQTFLGDIGIEFRGSSTQSFPKKPFGFETWDENQEDLNVSLFGWPEESDYILYPSYNEKSLMNNVLAMHIANEMGLYASRTKYIELLVNGDYQGIYVLMEKIKRDKGRVDISKLQNTGEDLTGGYIIKIDKSTGANYGSWVSKVAPPNNINGRIEFFYEYPDKTLTGEQRTYIKNYVDNFEAALLSPDFKDPLKGYRAYINTNTFIKYFLVNEVSKNVDGYRISTFLNKDKNGLLNAGPPWDYDIAFGNGSYCEGSTITGFGFNFNEICSNDYWLVPFWWQRLLQDPAFEAELKEEYTDLRTKGILKTENLMAFIDSNALSLNEAQARNFTKWPVLGTLVWPESEPVPETWQEEVSELKTWLTKRMVWLDQALAKPLVLGEDFENLSIQVFPNPVTKSFSLRYLSPKTEDLTVQIRTTSGMLVYSEKYLATKGENEFRVVSPIEMQTGFVEVYTPNTRYIKRIFFQ